MHKLPTGQGAQVTHFDLSTIRNLLNNKGLLFNHFLGEALDSGTNKEYHAMQRFTSMVLHLASITLNFGTKNS